jgi:hypothetical protein
LVDQLHWPAPFELWPKKHHKSEQNAPICLLLMWWTAPAPGIDVPLGVIVGDESH